MMSYFGLTGLKVSDKFTLKQIIQTSVHCGKSLFGLTGFKTLQMGTIDFYGAIHIK